MKQMDKDELSQQDGAEEGRRALVAFEGRIYDVTVSKLWRKGRHVRTHLAGQDLTMGMQAAPHGPEVLEKFEQVAELVEMAASEPELSPEPPPLVALLLSRHPHPMTVHFPIAFSLGAALFIALSLVVKEPALEQAALYNTILSALATPVSVMTGLLSWYYNYSAIWTHIYRMKTSLSILLGLLLTATLLIRFLVLPETLADGHWYWSYVILTMLTGPTVIGLGYYGGKITFPS